MEGARPLSEAGSASTASRSTPWWRSTTGYHRCGVPPEHVLTLARAVAHELPGLRFAGILAYEGHIYDLIDRSAVLREARRSYDIMREVAERLRDAGIPVERVSVGASATARAAADHPAVTELSPGSYIFNDRYQVSMGAVSVERVRALGPRDRRQRPGSGPRDHRRGVEGPQLVAADRGRRLRPDPRPRAGDDRSPRGRAWHHLGTRGCPALLDRRTGPGDPQLAPARRERLLASSSATGTTASTPCGRSRPAGACSEPEPSVVAYGILRNFGARERGVARGP